MRSLVAILALVPLCAHADDLELPTLGGARMRKIPFARCADGEKTALWIGGELPTMPLHDGPEGEATFEVRAGDRLVGSTKLPGRGICLGYVRELHAYAIASAHEIGAIVPVPSMLIVDEAGKSRGTAFGKNEYWAYTIVMSASKRRMAFVGDRDKSDGPALYVLDLVDDKIRKLGAAPSPPPSPGGPPRKGRWRWGIMGMDGYQDLEPEVLRFEAETLHASYGPDTMKARGKKRTEKMWPLDVLPVPIAK